MPLSDTNITTNQQQQPQQPLRILPYNVSFGTGNTDFIREDQKQCFGSSAPEGKFCMNNFHDIKQQARLLVQLKMNVTGYEYDNIVKWEDRDPLPIFRGHPRTNVRGYWKTSPATKCPNQINSTALGAFGHRPQAAYLAWEYPDLLDVQVSVAPNPCFAINTTNGLDRAFRLGTYRQNHTNNQNLTKRPKRIEKSDFYTKYQVAIVLGGIGAAFRMVNHLAAGQCVVLQRFKFEEWYYKFLTPYVNYIPIQQDLSDLISTARWIKEHPQEVKEIARKGQEFYREYLSFPRNNDHWHELLWRLSERLHETNSTHEERWEYENMVTFLRQPDGSFAEVADVVKVEK
jgi:Glycosyl transferase family 90